MEQMIDVNKPTEICHSYGWIPVITHVVSSTGIHGFVYEIDIGLMGVYNLREDELSTTRWIRNVENTNEG